MLERAIGLIAWVAVLFILAPMLIIAAGSFTETPYVAFPPHGFTLRWYAQLLHRRDFLDAFLISIGLAAACSVAAMALGVPAAIGLHRHAFPGRAVILDFLMSPLVLPTIVTGVALLQFYYLIELDASLAGLLAGHVLITVPYVIRTVGAGLVRLDPALEEASASLGAGPFATAVRVTVPSLAPSITAGTIFVFVTSFDQATVSIFLSGPEVMPLPVRIYTYIDFAVDPMIAAVTTLLLIMAFATVAVLQRALGLNRALGVD